MMVYVLKEISAGHCIDDEPKCGRFHGHNYRIEVSIEGSTDDRSSMVVNFDDIKKMIDEYDHKFLVTESHILEDSGGEFVKVELNHNTYSLLKRDIAVIKDFKQATAEALARVIASRIYNDFLTRVYKVRVRVWETSKSYAEVELP